MTRAKIEVPVEVQPKHRPTPDGVIEIQCTTTSPYIKRHKSYCIKGLYKIWGLYSMLSDIASNTYYSKDDRALAANFAKAIQEAFGEQHDA